MIFEAAEGFLAYLTRQVKSRSLAALRQLRVNARDDSLAVAEGFPFDFAQGRLSTAQEGGGIPRLRDATFASRTQTKPPRPFARND